MRSGVWEQDRQEFNRQVTQAYQLWIATTGTIPDWSFILDMVNASRVQDA